jgi:phosphoglycerol transferase MdoB-like AlkP superfamily enzyme
MELFPNFFSTFASSIHARFAVFTSLYPIQDYNAFTLERVPVKSLFEVLHETGYSCSLFYSSFADFTGFRDLLKQRGIDELYDADNMPGQRATERVAWGLREEETLGAMRSYIRKHASDSQRFFMTYIPASPHEPFEQVPARFQQFKATEPGDRTPAYLNQLLYMDWVMASIVDELKDTGLLEKTLVIITDDHGELLGNNGGPIGHGWLLTPELANAPLIIMDPAKPGYRVNPTIGAQIDILPTVLDLLRIPLPADQLYEGRSLYALQDDKTRRIYSNSYQQYGVIHQNRFIAGDREMDGSRFAGIRNNAYTISNEGAKTVFSGCQDSGSNTVSIREFDKFQESLLRNYSFYCASFGKPRRVASSE